MFKMRFCGAWALVLAASLRLMGCNTTCQMVNHSDHVEGACPVKVTSAQVKNSQGMYSQVTLRVRMKADDFWKSTRVEILSPNRKVLKPKLRRKHNQKSGIQSHGDEIRCCCKGVTQTATHGNTSLAMWELVYSFDTETGSHVSVVYSANLSVCRVNYSVPRPQPAFALSVNKSSKTIAVTVDSEDKVYVRWCYKVTNSYCTGPVSPQKTSQSALLNIHYLLPCICVEVYYTYGDALRHQKCPFQNKSLIVHLRCPKPNQSRLEVKFFQSRLEPDFLHSLQPGHLLVLIKDVGDILRSSEVELFESYINWQYKCPVANLNISASLCWKQREHLCIPVLNSTLEIKDGQTLKLSTSAVDKHPQMCVQFFVQGSHNITCLFQADMSLWETYIGPGKQSISVYLISYNSAKFSAQLCILTERGCTPMGPIHSITLEGKGIERRINVPSPNLIEKPCVQVWQSDPNLNGRRILCPNYTHNREGMYAVAVLVFVVVIILLGFFLYHFIKSVTTDWLIIHKPLLLVCSSNQLSHVSSVCALASVLQRELGATVHTSLWAQGSHRQAGSEAGVADLGPLPWLYGQWEAVHKAQGKVLIIWSPEAKKTYERWRKEKPNMSKKDKKVDYCKKANARHEKIRVNVEEDLKLNGRKLGNCKKEKSTGGKSFVELCDDKDWYSQKEPSTVIESVFVAALVSLEGAQQECKSKGASIVYFQGLCHSKDIPKTLRGVSRYCLPQDFSGLIQELGQLSCWPRLLSKGLSLWLARKLAQRLQALLPQTQGCKVHGLSLKSSMRMTSDQTQSRLKLPLAAELGDVREQELLQGSSWRAEES